jgi:ribonuclease HI
MEPRAVLEALRAITGPLAIQVDSKYVNGMSTSWLSM